MNATTPTWRPNRRRLWSNWLWLLAGVLSLAALWSGVRVVHDGRLRRETLRLLAHDKANEIALLGEHRFNLLIREAFSPLWSRGQPANQLSRLRAFHSEPSACGCMDTLPITTFFVYDASRSPVYDPASATLSVSRGTGPAVIADSTLQRVAAARFDNEVQEFRHPRVFLTVDSTLGGQAIVTITDPHSASGGTNIYGAVMPATALAATLFDVIPRGRSADTVVKAIVVKRLHIEMGAVAHRGEELVSLDSLSIRVSAGDRTLFGGIGDGRYVSAVRGAGALAPLTVAVGIKSTQASIGVLMPVAHDRLWLNGVITLCTTLVVVFAIGSSRRELLLARARSDFIAGVSHDLRMPLAQVLLASETLTLGRYRDEGDREKLSASILREARRLNHMVDNVLLFSRTGAVGLKPHRGPVNVADLFTDVIESVNLAAADAGQSLESVVEPGVHVAGDRNLLRQAFVNLVDNAIKYGDRGQRIRLTAREEVRIVRLTVEDEGPGIPTAERARLFEAYERLGRDQTSERTGSGLGLAVVRQIVAASGGEVFFDDAATIGTRVVITLPVSPS